MIKMKIDRLRTSYVVRSKSVSYDVSFRGSKSMTVEFFGVKKYITAAVLGANESVPFAVFPNLYRPGSPI